MDELSDCCQSYDDCIASARSEEECLEMSTICGSPNCDAFGNPCLELGGSDEECSIQYEECTGPLLLPEEPPTNVDIPIEEDPSEEIPSEDRPVDLPIDTPHQILKSFPPMNSWIPSTHTSHLESMYCFAMTNSLLVSPHHHRILHLNSF